MFQSLLFDNLLSVATPVLFGVCLVISSIGFRKTVYFISIGYGFSIAGMAIVSLATSAGKASAAGWVIGALLLVYGLRLGIYLSRRETKAAYRSAIDADVERSRPIGFGINMAIWVTVSFLYVSMFMPLEARIFAESRGLHDGLAWLSWLGATIMAAGILIETIADRQKTMAKERTPSRFCDSGLYRVVRCPNYFGELLVWTGNLVAGIALLGNWLQWILAIAGYVSIYLIMKGSARRLEIKQGERYGANPDFQTYVKSVPILLPLLPIYSLRKAKLYLG